MPDTRFEKVSLCLGGRASRLKRESKQIFSVCVGDVSPQISLSSVMIVSLFMDLVEHRFHILKVSKSFSWDKTNHTYRKLPLNKINSRYCR